MATKHFREKNRKRFVMPDDSPSFEVGSLFVVHIDLVNTRCLRITSPLVQYNEKSAWGPRSQGEKVSGV